MLQYSVIYLIDFHFYISSDYLLIHPVGVLYSNISFKLSFINVTDIFMAVVKLSLNLLHIIINLEGSRFYVHPKKLCVCYFAESLHGKWMATYAAFSCNTDQFYSLNILVRSAVVDITPVCFLLQVLLFAISHAYHNSVCPANHKHSIHKANIFIVWSQ